MHGQQNIKKVQLVFVAGCKGSSVRMVYIFVLDIQVTTEDNISTQRAATEHSTINFYVACVGRFQCKMMDVECFQPTICKQIFIIQLKTAGFEEQILLRQKKVLE